MSRTLEMIEWEQKLLLILAYSYNTEDNPMASDMIYDYGVARLKSIKDMHPTVWAESKVSSRVFLDPDEAWRYTSSHFPTTPEVICWFEQHKKSVAESKQRIKSKST